MKGRKYWQGCKLIIMKLINNIMKKIIKILLLTVFLAVFSPGVVKAVSPSISWQAQTNVSGSPYDVVVSGNYAYSAEMSNGLVITNVADPANAYVVG